MTLSRGGALALGVGGFVTIAALVTQRFVANDTPRRRRASFFASSLPIGIVSVCAVVVVLYASAGGVTEQFTHTSLDELHAPRSKFARVALGEELVDESPWVGVGRGAFEPVFQRVHPASAVATYTHLENEYLQAVVDWGVPSAAILAFVAIWLVVVALRRWRDGPLAAGALGALAAVLLQSNVDFGIEFLGLAAPITAVTATLSTSRCARRRPAASRDTYGAARARRRASHRRAVARVKRYHDDRRRSRGARGRSDARSERSVTSPIRLLRLRARRRVARPSNDPNAVRLLNHALTLHPTDPGLHIAAHAMLYARRASRASGDRVRGRAAVRARLPSIARGDHSAVRRRHSQRSRSPPIWCGSTPGCASSTEFGRGDIALAWLEHFVLLQPHALHACERLYAWATQRSDLDAIDVLKQRCVDYQPSQDDRIALARVLRAKHADASIVPLLGDVESWQGRSDQKVEAWKMLCDAQLELGKFDDAKRCLRRLDGTGIVAQLLGHDRRRARVCRRRPAGIRDRIGSLHLDVAPSSATSAPVLASPRARAASPHLLDRPSTPAAPPARTRHTSRRTARDTPRRNRAARCTRSRRPPPVAAAGATSTTQPPPKKCARARTSRASESGAPYAGFVGVACAASWSSCAAIASACAGSTTPATNKHAPRSGAAASAPPGKHGATVAIAAAVSPWIHRRKPSAARRSGRRAGPARSSDCW